MIMMELILVVVIEEKLRLAMKGKVGEAGV
jgi:hypothetical protein